MTVLKDVANILNQYYLWLSSRQLVKWWPLLIVIAGLFILLIVLFVRRLRSRRKVLPNFAQLQDIIGIELADDVTTAGRTDPTENDSSANVPKKRGRRKKRKNTKKEFKMAIEPPREPKIYEILPDHEPIKLKANNNSQAKQHPIQKASEIAAVNKKFQLEKTEQEKPSNALEESAEKDSKSNEQPQPFNISEFSKSAISRRQRQRSHIYKEYSELEDD